MSEMKSFSSERIYWAVEQVEREAGDIDDLHLDDNLFYIKSEADKVIAELEDKLQAANEQIENLINSTSCIMLSQDGANDNMCAELRHAKYKRCLAMAEACMHKRWRNDEGFDYARSTRHMNKWLELA